LFGKRTAVHDAHDRYANVEVSYLLQRMEDYQGVVILATNLRKNMDEAFLRRVQFTIEFPLPSQHERLRIWRQIWPPQTPRDPDLDYAVLAERFEMTGGSIRNVALAAAYLAAADEEVVRLRHILQATRREYRKLGKVVAEREFA